MSATTTANRPPPAHPGPNGGTPHPRANDGPPAQQQDPGLHGGSQDPGPSAHPQHHVPGRPLFYVHGPPPPPFLQYQWPMPFSYNPFVGFPGMGYGMVMPPLPPPPYMEHPAYILPHPQLQPVDYRRMLHPQVYAPSAPYQNQNYNQNPTQTRRFHLPHTAPVRETVNSEVQTDPTRRRAGGYCEESQVLSTDSGGGTASSSPSPLSSVSKKRVSANDKPVKGSSPRGAVKRRVDDVQPAGLKTVQERIRASLEKQQHHKDAVRQDNARCSVWSVSSADSMVPVCSSSQQEDVVHERLKSVPDILMSWGGGTPQATKQATAPTQANAPTPEDEPPQKDVGAAVERQFVYQSPAGGTKGPAADDNVFADDADGTSSSRDGANLFKILKMRDAHEERKAESTSDMGVVGSGGHCPSYRDERLRSLKSSDELFEDEPENGDETNPHEDAADVTADVTPYPLSLNSGRMKRKMNESVWSVESLAPFIPSKEWLMQNCVFEPQVVFEMTEEAENGRPDKPTVTATKGRRPTSRCSSSDSVLLSESWLMFSTPAEKPSPPTKLEVETEMEASETRRPNPGQNIVPSEKDSFTSPTRPPPYEIVTSPSPEEDVGRNGSSEPEAIRSPNQNSLVLVEQRVTTPCCSQPEETLPLKSAPGGELSPPGRMTVQNRAVPEAERDADGNDEVGQPQDRQLCVPMADPKMAEVSPSRGQLVDCGVQCTQLKDCDCQERGRHEWKCTDKKTIGGQADGFGLKGRMPKKQKKNHWRNKGQDKSSQQEADHGNYGKPQGGNGRNQRF